ncbi:MAG: alpha/beta hydrolase [Microlunatus sp.]|nr:alpha/beta hydrolase [Microlunatus sp.]
MHITTSTTTDGVVQQTFDLDGIPGVLWTPESPTPGAPLILIGHPGGQHKLAPGPAGRARHYVAQYGFSAAAIDAPGHGDRPRDKQDQRWVEAMFRAREAGQSLAPVITELNLSLAERAVPEWQATIDALQQLPDIGTAAPIGYGGLTLGSAIGIPLITEEPRIGAAVLGGVFTYPALFEAARMVTIPVQFLLPWDDTEIDRQTGLELFDALGSAAKTMHVTTGGHHEVPFFETDDSARFYARHLQPAA